MVGAKRLFPDRQQLMPRTTRNVPRWRSRRRFSSHSWLQQPLIGYLRSDLLFGDLAFSGSWPLLPCFHPTTSTLKSTSRISPLHRIHANASLERSTEGRGSRVPYLGRNPVDGFVRIFQQAACSHHAPAGHICHGRLADGVSKPGGKARRR